MTLIQLLFSRFPNYRVQMIVPTGMIETIRQTAADMLPNNYTQFDIETMVKYMVINDFHVLPPVPHDVFVK